MATNSTNKIVSIQEDHVLINNLSQRNSNESASSKDFVIYTVDEHTGTIYSSSVILCNTILGSGLLAMPFALSNVGLFLGMFLILFSGFASGFGLYLLGKCAQEIPDRKSSFFSVAEQTYPKAALLFDLAVAIKCFGVSISYLIIFGDLVPQVVTFFTGNDTSFFATRLFWITFGIVGMTPLTFQKRLDSLKYASLVAMFAVLYFVIVVSQYYFFADRIPPPKDDIKYVNFSYAILKNISLFVFAFTCHQNIFSIHNELKDNSFSNINKIIIMSIGFCMCLYQWVANPENAATSYCRIAVAVFVISAYPLQCHPARASINRIVNSFSSVNNHDLIIPEEPNRQENDHSLEVDLSSEEQLSRTSEAVQRPDSSEPAMLQTVYSEATDPQYYIITTAILVFSYLIAVSIKELGLVLSFVGSTGSTSISFILPGILYWKMHEKSPPSIIKNLSIILVIYGIVVMVVSLYVNFTT
ncbi:hypothetical protein BB559_004252 [Furculomyces boomerangus]|uniref:Amino acid transporter transmembrane domain-containing protein n=1 Tax=Furculomyces boomerangus TaxID=61424 RepID=A0A2T9YFW1_9FUNG|nr:hypothetical protein BB559_004252 [Furculomyces boomerangus]